MVKPSRNNVSANPAKAQALFASAAEYLQQSEYKLAIARLKKADKLVPENHAILFNLGGAHQQLTMFKEAAGYYRRCTKIKPEIVDTWRNLAVCLRNLRHFSDSISAYKKLMQLQTLDNDELNDVATVYAELGNFTESIQLYRQVVERDPERIDFKLNLAMTLMLNNEQGASEELYRSILMEQPAQPTALHGLAQILENQQRLHELSPILSQLHQLDPSIDSYVRLGNCLTLLGESERAKDIYEEGLQTAPQNTVLLTNLGVLYSIAGEKTRAETFMRNALNVDPSFTDAWRHLTSFTTYDDCEHSDGIQMQSLLRKKLNPQREAALHFSLGKLYDDCGSYVKALKHFEVGNRLRRKSIDFNLDLLDEHANRIRNTFTAGLITPQQEVSDKGEGVILIIGLPRSGTTLLEQVLSSITQVQAGGEMLVINELLQELETSSRESYPEACASFDDHELMNLSSSVITRYMSNLSADEHHYIIDKMPFNFFHIGLIHKLLPAATIIECRRNIYDTCLSAFFNWFPKGMDYTYDYAELAKFCRIYVEMMNHWRKECSIPIFTGNYENLVKTTQNELSDLFSNLGFSWHEQMLNFHEQKTEVRTISAWQVRKPLHTASVGRINNYEGLMHSLCAELKKHGF